jgi:hypothetical protein
MSWHAVESLLQTEALRAYMGNGVDPRLRADVETLGRQYLTARATAKQSLREAGVANVAAKRLVAELAPRAGLGTKLQGVIA